MVLFCPTCSEDFEDYRSLQGHNRCVHPYWPECDRCYACFPKGEFVGHKCKVPGPVMCEDCFKVYASVKDLMLHLVQSGHVCKSECGDCGEPRPALDLK